MDTFVDEVTANSSFLFSCVCLLFVAECQNTEKKKVCLDGVEGKMPDGGSLGNGDGQFERVPVLGERCLVFLVESARAEC